MSTVNLVAYCGSDRLTNVWLYLKQGDACTRLRSDADGLLLQTISTDPDPEIASFVEPFVAEAPATVVLGWSRNGLPLPPALLNLAAAAFTEVKLELKPENLAPLASAPIASHATNTIQAVPMVKVVLPPLPVVFEEPTALQLWPMFAEPFAADYATDGLPQGASLWNGDHLTVRDGHSATPASAQKIPKDLGVGIRGTVKNGAKQVDLYLLDAKGERLKFRLKAEANAPAAEVKKLRRSMVQDRRSEARGSIRSRGAPKTQKRPAGNSSPAGRFLTERKYQSYFCKRFRRRSSPPTASRPAPAISAEAGSGICPEGNPVVLTVLLNP